MYFDFEKKSCVEIAKETMDSLGIKLEDLREYGDKLLEEIYIVFDSKVKIEMYEFNCNIYYIRHADNQCVEFRKVK